MPVMTVNAGAILLKHWTQDVTRRQRLTGEGCHFVDRYVISSAPQSRIATFGDRRLVGGTSSDKLR
jgi:hypothetical protein